MVNPIKNLVEEIEKIKERNKKVELDKAWETSLTRKIIVSVLTYLVIVSFFYVADLSKPWINSIVPTVGFILSTPTLTWFRKIWVKFR